MRMVDVSDNEYEYKIQDLSGLRKIVLRFPSSHWVGGWLFRGQSNHSWPLIPKAGRPPYNDKGSFYEHRFSQWCREARAYAKDFPENIWERLALAQHHGLATNLLDWSANPLVAAYFACKELESEDGAIYCYFPTRYITESERNEFTDFKNNEVVGYIPNHFSRRIVAQSGYFTFHQNPQKPVLKTELTMPFKGQQLKKILIKNSAKQQFIDELNLYGLNQKSLFPDLDGLSSYINWLTLVGHPDIY